ncbi:MAG TPA: DUF167 domain-containing protein [Phycisphaerales bacterium]|nr:DUF167 domain-containing protein [Phycisphaerales bacterium]
MFRDEHTAQSGGTPAATIAVKVVPSSRRDRIAGPLGDRLKINVSAPPEDGRANGAVCGLLAKALGLPRRGVSVVAGASSPEKTIRVVGIDASGARIKLGL